MEFFRDTNIQFMKYRRVFVGVSAALLIASVLTVFVGGRLNLGIDFAGGTQLTLKFRQAPEVEELRSVVAAAGITETQIQRFGEEDANAVIIKTPTAEQGQEGSRDLIVEALDRRYNAERADRFDLNRRGLDALADLLLELDPDLVRTQDEETAGQHYDEVAQAIVEVRREQGLIDGWEQIESAPAVGAGTVAALRERAVLGDFAVLGAENVGPLIGAELRQKGVLAVVLSLLGMLIYIWYRFELRFGIGALVAVTHDVVIVLGFYAAAGFEFNLTTIAAFLTLVGYSVNDTVVVFDRVRENLRRRRRQPLAEVLDLSLNQTLSRTVLTSGTTLLALGCLLVLGGDVLRGFAFILTIGIVVGTYSSIFVASPFALLWENWFGATAKARRATGTA
jgi:preprotein translocase subunit SecF